MDPWASINSVLPTPEALEKDGNSARESALKLETYLCQQIRNSKPTEESLARIAEGPGQLQDLVKKAADIHAVGYDALTRVDGVTHEIKRLDRTKENLTQTIRMLRQFRMLSKLATQLQQLLKAKRYDEIPACVGAASDLATFFKPFRSLPRVAELSQQVTALENELFQNVCDDLVHAVHNSRGDLKSGIQSIAALRKEDYKDQLMRKYADTMLAEYRRIFGISDEAGSLENVKQRYTYLRKIIFTRHELFDYWFPNEWNVRDFLISTALSQTRSDIIAGLKSLKFETEHDIQVLVSSLAETREFEVPLRTRKLSELYTPFLEHWVEFQDHQIENAIKQYRRQPAIGSESEVFQSSTDLVHIYRALLQQMQRMSSGPPLLSLGRVFSHWFKRYCDDILGGSTKNPRRVALTAHYLQTTVTQLESAISESLDEKLRDELDISSCRSRMASYLDAAVETLAVRSADQVEKGWIDMAQANWRGRNDVDGSAQPYVATISVELETSMRKAMTGFENAPGTIYHLCVRVVEIICVNFLATGLRAAKPVSELSAEQLLLDFSALKKTLTGLPNLVEHSESVRLKRFPETVHRTLDETEAIIKTLMGSPEPQDAFVRQYITLVKDRSPANFRKVAEAKGLRYQPMAVENFKLLASQDPNLIKQSPLLPQISLIPPAVERPESPGMFRENFRRIGELLRPSG